MVVGGRGAPVTDQNPAPGKDSRCSFANEPAMPYYWDADCSMGKLGCMADGLHQECRFCAQRPFEGIPCPEEVAPPAYRCSFPEGAAPGELYYWDAECELGKLGCWADGIHAQCRFCGGTTFQNVTCPTVRVTGASDFEIREQEARGSSRQVEQPPVGAALDVRPQDQEDEQVDLSRAAGLALPALCWAATAAAVLIAWSTCEP
eukprot:SRR837773.23343.p2 GENE.SRR837773.23343~~SRR837773.23343.p2  ORF type:complete len:212 (-),score=38.80 SRR837773.23343:55-666(-)